MCIVENLPFNLPVSCTLSTTTMMDVIFSLIFACTSESLSSVECWEVLISSDMGVWVDRWSRKIVLCVEKQVKKSTEKSRHTIARFGRTEKKSSAPPTQQQGKLSSNSTIHTNTSESLVSSLLCSLSASTRRGRRGEEKRKKNVWK